MKRSFFAATFVAALSLLFLSSRPSLAQGTPSPQRATVVVIDVIKVFQNHNRFKQATEVMKKDVADFENHITLEREKINKLTEELKQFNAGTPNYNMNEKKIHQHMADLQVEMTIKRKELMDREASLYANVYEEITRHVARFANENGISLVLDYRSDPIDPADRKTVMMGVNNPIVFQRNLDITSWIIKLVNEGSTPVSGGGGANPNTARGPQIPQPRSR